MIRLLAACAALLLTGCAMGPDFQQPVVPEPIEYRVDMPAGESIGNLAWFDLFNDENLNSLIRTALEENKDLLTAVARVEESRAALGFVRADQFPGIGLQGAATRANLFNGISTSGINEQFVLGAGLNFEVDLWGRLRRATESARAQLLATVEARNVVLTTLISDVAASYFLLLDTDQRIQIAEETLASRIESTRIIQARYDRGTVALLDLNQAQIEEGDAAAELASLRGEQQQTENILNLLIGRNPSPIIRDRQLDALDLPPSIPVGLPSELLERRPDIRQAEANLAAQTADIGVAQASRFPALNLTGLLGLASPDLSGFVDSDNKAWSVGASLTGPLFDAGKLRSGVDVERAQAEQALLQYENTVIQAFVEVENALISISALSEELLIREKQVVAARSAAMLSRARYDGGVTSYLEVLESERAKFRTELSESVVRRRRLVAFTTLYRALGGGWNPEPEE
jgi:multidrug efflux system outer membrane protein